MVLIKCPYKFHKKLIVNLALKQRYKLQFHWYFENQDFLRKSSACYIGHSSRE